MKRILQLSIQVALFAFLFTSGYQGFAQDDEFNATIDEGTEQKTSDKGGVGSFGRGLSKFGNFISINGFVTNEFFLFEEKGVPSTFDQHYFNVIVSGELNDRLLTEIQLEYEHGGEEIEIRYAQLDLKLIKNSDKLILRTGKFLTPAGEFNEYLYPEYLNKIVNRAYVNREIVPSAWGEVGVQLRGKFNTNDSSAVLKPYYAVYVVNGLQAPSGVTDIRSMRGNNRDKEDNNKAFGGSLGTEIGPSANISANYYRGVYSEDGNLGLDIYGVSGHFDNGAMSFYGALHLAQQDVFLAGSTTDTKILSKSGFYLQGAYKFSNKLEPVIRYDQINLDGASEDDRQRISFGLNYHLFDNAVLKAHYDVVSDDGTDIDDNILSFQFAVGF